MRCNGPRLEQYLADMRHLTFKVVDPVLSATAGVVNVPSEMFTSIIDGKPVEGHFPVHAPSGKKIAELELIVAYIGSVVVPCLLIAVVLS